MAPIISSGLGVSYSSFTNNPIPDDTSQLCTTQPSISCINSDDSSSNDDGEPSSSSDDAVSSSSGDGSDDGSGNDGDFGEDDDEFGLCFSSYGEASISNMMRSTECLELGGDASGLWASIRLRK